MIGDPRPSCVSTLLVSPLLLLSAWLPLVPQASLPSGQLRGQPPAKSMPALIYSYTHTHLGKLGPRAQNRLCFEN